MKTPLLIAAVCAGLPGCAMQDPASPVTPGTELFASSCAMQDAPRASSALPARATTTPAPQLGSVAPAMPMPSHACTPSMRAMERAMAAQTAGMQGGEKNMSCHHAVAKPASKGRAG